MPTGNLAVGATQPPPSNFTWSMVNIGGGGYGCGMSLAKDASNHLRILSRNDEPGGWLYKGELTVPNKWRCITTYPGMPNQHVAGMGGMYEGVYGTYPIAYMVTNDPVGTQGSGGRGNARSCVYKSIDGGDTWSQTAMTAISGYVLNKFSGPHMAVDKNNNNICYVNAFPGSIHYTYNGGATWRVCNTLLGALKSATATANSVSGGNSFEVDLNPIAGTIDSQYACYDVQHPLALGTNGGNDLIGTCPSWIGSITGTTLTVTKCIYAVPINEKFRAQGSSAVTVGTSITGQIIKGTVADDAHLPTTGQVYGDTYLTTADGQYKIWTGSAWGGATASSSTSSGSIYDYTVQLTGVTNYITADQYPPNANSISGTNIPAGTKVLLQLSGVPGGDGNYYLSNIPTGVVSGVITTSGRTPLNTIGQYTVSASQTVSSQLMASRVIHIQQLENADGGGGDGTVAVASGDTIKFGLAAVVLVDEGSGTVANPGIALGDPGAAGLASKNVFFGWSKGATSMWFTTNGNPESAVAMTGGPVELGGNGAIAGKAAISNDKNLVGGGNVLYVSDGDQFGWRYVGAVPPTGSGLTANTWTHLTNDMSQVAMVAPDPFVAGRVAFLGYRQGVQGITKDYGATIWSYGVGTPASVAGDGGLDAPWIATCAGYFGADAAWDPTTQNRLWMTSGTGHFYCDVPTTAGALSLTYVSQVCGNESIIPCKIVKAPSPNGRILIACEDRPFFSLVDAIQPTTNYFPNSGIGGGVSQGYDIVYSDSDPTVCWGTDGGSIWRSTDKGLTYTSLGIGGWTTLASTTPLSCVSIGYSSQQCHYTTDGGTTWNVCQYFNGSTNVPFLGTGGTSYNTSFVVTTDKAGTYYCYDPYGANTGSAALFKSTNGGATWTLVSSQASAIMGGGGGCLISVPGTTPLHLIAANGYSGAGYYNFSAPLSFSKNAGVTWQTASETYFASSVTIGKKNPTSTYPYTVYMAGNLVSLGEYGIYRCDDFGATTRTWTLMPGLKNVTCDSLRGGLSGDLEVYGTLFAGTSGAGAAWVRLT